MSKSFKCDMTGEVVEEGESIKQLFIDLTPTLRLEIIPHQRIGRNAFGQGDLCKVAVQKIQGALAVLRSKEQKQADEDAMAERAKVAQQTDKPGPDKK